LSGGQSVTGTRFVSSWRAANIAFAARKYAGLRLEQKGIERRAPELCLFLERLAQIIGERLDVDRRNASLAFEHGHLLGRDRTPKRACAAYRTSLTSNDAGVYCVRHSVGSKLEGRLEC